MDEEIKISYDTPPQDDESFNLKEKMNEILIEDDLSVFKKKNRNFSIIFWLFSILAIIFKPAIFYLMIGMALSSSGNDVFLMAFFILLVVCFIVLSITIVSSTYFLTKSIKKSIIFVALVFVGIFIPVLPLAMVPELFFSSSLLLLIPYLFIKREYLNLINNSNVNRFWYLPGAIFMGLIFTISLQGSGLFVLAYYNFEYFLR